jgi:hypothetical protein
VIRDGSLVGERRRCNEENLLQLNHEHMFKFKPRDIAGTDKVFIVGQILDRKQGPVFRFLDLRVGKEEFIDRYKHEETYPRSAKIGIYNMSGVWDSFNPSKKVCFADHLMSLVTGNVLMPIVDLLLFGEEIYSLEKGRYCSFLVPRIVCKEESTDSITVMEELY